MQPTRRVAVIGLGYVGLPVAAAATAAGLEVIGFDSSPAVVAGLLSGRSHVDDISDEDVTVLLATGLAPTSDPADLAGCDTFVICVPTPLSAQGGPDLAQVAAAGRTVAAVLGPGCLVVLESTSYPGTTEHYLKPILEAGGLIAGGDFNLAFSPERIDPGNRRHTFRTTPKVVAGLTPACRDRAAGLYGLLVDTVVPAGGLMEAELAKLLENTYRQVNIALVNEMARFCHDLGIDLWDAIRCAETKPFGFEAFRPGPGVGGHCIPIDPNYLSHHVHSETGYAFRFVELAQEINSGMPAYVATRTADMLAADGLDLSGSTVLLIGVTYKADVADLRESPAIGVAEELLSRGALVRYLDPHVPRWVVGDREIPRVEPSRGADADCACVVVLQHHEGIDLDGILAPTARILDTRGILPMSRATRL